MSARSSALRERHTASHDYVMGFVLSVVLTGVPFWLVMTDTLEAQVTAFVIVALAAVQMIVHVVYFLHVRLESEKGWTLISLVFTLIFLVIVLAGSLWVMYHLDGNMTSIQEIGQLP